MIKDKEIQVPVEFSDICPIADKDFHNEMSILVEEPEFQSILSMIAPQYTFSQIKKQLLSLNTKHEFQATLMCDAIDGMLQKTTDGLTWSGIAEMDKETPYTYVTNHRDIVLDATQLGYIRIHEDCEAPEVAIGNNLLIYDWIKKLVRLNRSFIVKRNLGKIQTLQAAVQLSSYIHFAVTQKNKSVWIAQREGRCKDSNDRTQESLLKMLTYGNRDKSIVDSLKELNIAPIALCYEYDPNDYLKAKEFLMKSKNPNWKKSPKDDLVSMQTGITGYKGHVHYAFTPCINDELDKIPQDLDRMLTISRICNIIDHAIHEHYMIFKTNYIAHDILFDNKEFADKYTEEEKDAFTKYLGDQIDKITDVKLTDFDRYFLYSKMLQMYSNPLTNHLEAMK